MQKSLREIFNGKSEITCSSAFFSNELFTILYTPGLMFGTFVLYQQKEPLQANLPNDYQRLHRSSRPEVFIKKGVLKNFAKFTGKHLCRSLLSIKLQASGFTSYLNLYNKLKGLLHHNIFVCCISSAEDITTKIYFPQIKLENKIKASKS